MKFAIQLLVITTLLSVSSLIAGEMSHGEMAGIIRSSDLPCAHVLNLQETSKSSWTVECNAGTYNVNRTSDEAYSVSAVQDSKQEPQ